MAIHVNTAADVDVPACSVAGFLAQIQNGDLIFCSGSARISLAIEHQTQSPWSHIGQVWIVAGFEDMPFIMESTINRGVNIDPLICNYVGCYDGDLVLTRRPCLSKEGIIAIQKKFITIQGDKYDWQSEVGFAAHNLLKFLPVQQPVAEYFCSGAQQYASTAWSPFLKPNATGLIHATPEDNWTDDSVVPVCKLLRGTK